MLNLPHLRRNILESAQRKMERRLLIIAVLLIAFTFFCLGLLVSSLMAPVPTWR